MASVYREAAIAAPPEKVWAALADFGAVHERLVPGFVTACTVDDAGATRTVTFHNGSVAREVLVGRDDDHRRLAYTVVDGPLDAQHHNAAAQVLPGPDDTSRFVWVTDVLPDHLAPTVGQMMEAGLAVMAHTLGPD